MELKMFALNIIAQKSKFIFLGFLFLGSSLTWASALKGVREVDLLVENLDSDARSCGVSSDMIDAAIRLPISNTRLKLVQKDGNGYVYANANIIDLGARCVMNLTLQYNKLSISELQYGVFWSKSSLWIWPKNDTKNQVEKEFDSFARQFIAAWLKANSN